jgi:hypothetical protein
MTADLLIERWNDLRATLNGFHPRDIEIVRTAFYLGARSAIDAAIAAPAGSVRLVLMRAELSNWYRGIKRDVAA